MQPNLKIKIMKKLITIIGLSLLFSCTPEEVQEVKKCNCEEVSEIRYMTIVNGIWNNPAWQSAGANKISAITDCIQNNKIIATNVIPTSNTTAIETRKTLICK